MKYSDLLAERRGAVTIEDAERIVRGRGNAPSGATGGWLTPQVQGNRLTLFDYDECVACWKRICVEGYEALKQSAENRETPVQFHRH